MSTNNAPVHTDLSHLWTTLQRLEAKVDKLGEATGVMVSLSQSVERHERDLTRLVDRVQGLEVVSGSSQVIIRHLYKAIPWLLTGLGLGFGGSQAVNITTDKPPGAQIQQMDDAR